MSLVLADRVRQTSTTTGSGTLTLDGSVTGFQSFAAIGNGNTTYYTITLDAQWEVGIGTYSAGTLTRDTVISSSTGSKIVFGAGVKDVFVTLPSEKAVISGTDAVLTKLTTPTVQATNSGGLSLKNSAGTTQISMGGGGGDNVSVNVSTNMNGSNAQIDISPTGTGHVHMKPTGTGSIEVAPTNVGTIDNMTIGATTPKAITGTTITATSFSGSGSGLTSIPNSALTNSSITINGAATSLGGSVNVGTVTSASVVSANGFAGTVATDTTTPAITLSTSITGVLKGNGAAISAASAGTDYQAPITLTTTGTSGAATFIANTLNIPQYSGGGGSGTVTSVAATVPSFLAVTGSPITTSGTLAIGYSGTALPIANGGTGQTDRQSAINALVSTVTNRYFLRGNNTNAVMAMIQAADVPTLNQDTTGTAANITATSNSTLTTLSALSLPGSQVSGNISGNAANVTGTVAIANGGTGATTASVALTNLGAYPASNPSGYGTGTVTSVSASVPSFLSVSGSPVTTSGTLAISYSGTALPIANGGTGQTTATAAFNALSPITTAGDLILGDGANSATRLAIGTDGQILSSNGSTAAWGSRVNSATAVASTSGTSIDFTNIPSWVKRITLMFSGVSTNGTNIINVQLGTGAGPTFVTTGYNSPFMTTAASSMNTQLATSGFSVINPSTAASLHSGTFVLTILSSNTWTGFGSCGTTSGTRMFLTSGAIALGAALTAVRITTADTFDAGIINILYE
jgi:hypothetical protein